MSAFSLAVIKTLVVLMIGLSFVVYIDNVDKDI